MDHSIPLITTIAAGFGLALVLGFVAARLKLPPLVGYLLAGIVIGPATPGFVADVEIAGQLAEIGVMLLMFGVGLHFSLDDLLAVRTHRAARRGRADRGRHRARRGRRAAAGAGACGAALVFGLALSVASTVVLLRALESRGVLDSINGRIAVGWLVVEDLAMVLVLVLLPPLAALLGGTATRTAPAADSGRRSASRSLKVGGLRRADAGGRPARCSRGCCGRWRAPARASCSRCAWWRRRSSIAYGSAELFGVSFALGAFFAGMVLRESEFSHRAAEESLPLRDAFAVLFFVSVGMLFDPQRAGRASRCRCWRWSRSSWSASRSPRSRWCCCSAIRSTPRSRCRPAWRRSASSRSSWPALGVSLGLLPAEGQSLILAGALISIALNPLVFARDRAGCSAGCARARRSRAQLERATTRWPSCR